MSNVDRVAAPVTRLPLGTLNLLGILFVAFKLGGVISWPWLWVLAPFWATFAVAAIIAALAGILIMGAAIVDRISK